MAEICDETLDRAAAAAGLKRALAEHRDDVHAAARAAVSYQQRRVPVDDMALEPAHVCHIPDPEKAA